MPETTNVLGIFLSRSVLRGEKKHYGLLVSYSTSTRGSGEACWKPPETPSCDRCMHAWCIFCFSVLVRGTTMEAGRVVTYR